MCTEIVSFRLPNRFALCHTDYLRYRDADGEVYDLSALTNPTSDYAVSSRGDTGNRTYSINVCHSIVDDNQCPPGSAACMKDGDR